MALIGAELEEAARAGALPAVSIWDALNWVATTHGERDALIAGSLHVSYNDLRVAVIQTAAHLRAAGIEPGAHVGLLGTNTLDWLVAFLSIVSAGAVCVPLNARLTDAELVAAVGVADVTHLILRPTYRRRAHDTLIDRLLASSTLSADRIFTIDGELVGHERAIGSAGPPGDVADLEDPDPESVAVILFTSGSTAAAKGCLLTHQGVVRNACLHGARLDITSDDIWFSPMPFFHAGGLIWGIGTCLVTGATLAIQEVFDAGECIELVESIRPTYFHGVDTMYARILDHPSLSPQTFRSVTRATTIGPPELLRRIHDELGIEGIESKWGLSEGYGNLTLCSPSDPLERRLESVGSVFPGIEYSVCDPRTGDHLEPGSVGEVLIRGCAMEGYYNDPNATREMIDADGWIHTGDLGRFDEGFLYFLGRAKNMLKVGGENVSPLEIEETLQGFPHVDAAYVVGVSDPARGEVPVAALVATRERVLDIDEIRAYCVERLAPFKVPVRFVELRHDELPLTGSGKISKPDLEALLANGIQRG